LIDGNTITGNEPGGGTYILFDLHKGHPNLLTYDITHVRLHGSTSTYTWDVYVGNDLSDCTEAEAWGTRVGDDWSVGGASVWYETAVTETSGRYIKLVTTGDIGEDTIFEFGYKSTQTGEDWQTPVMVVYKCTDIAEDNYELLSGSPAEYGGEDSVEMGAYGGSGYLDW
jgi:hypothetical protein